MGEAWDENRVGGQFERYSNRNRGVEEKMILEVRKQDQRDLATDWIWEVRKKI